VSQTTETDAQEAEETLFELLDKVELGEQFVITRNGKAVARLEPPPTEPTSP
jgi:prevent-host-death family protein